jgi:hypothetical protein
MASELKAAGFTQDDISVLFPDRTGSKDFAHERHTKMPEGAATGAGAGGAIGAALGWLAGIGSLAIPGIGPFVAAGPILATLGGAAVGAAAGGVTGALVGLGIPENKAQHYEVKLKKGNILLSVHCEDDEQESVATEIFEASHAEDITVASDAAARAF